MAVSLALFMDLVDTSAPSTLTSAASTLSVVIQRVTQSLGVRLAAVLLNLANGGGGHAPPAASSHEAGVES